jgi:hypothetical protein
MKLVSFLPSLRHINNNKIKVSNLSVLCKLFSFVFIAEIFLVRGKMKFSKLRSGCHLSVFELTEKCHGKVREGVVDDGIRYQDRSEHLTFQLVFKEESQAEDFIIFVVKIPQNYRKRKLSETANVPPDLEVELEPIQKVTNDLNLVLVTTEDYQRVAGEYDESPEISTFSGSQFSTVEMSPEVQFRLIDQENSFAMFRKRPEKCHLISQSKYKDDKYNPNNIIFMSSLLHEYFDGINSSVWIPTFYLDYVAHDPTPIQGVVEEKPCPVYETTVKAVFHDEEARSVLSSSFKSHTVISNTEIQFVLYFPAPKDFETFAKLNAEIKISQWKAYDGLL